MSSNFRIRARPHLKAFYNLQTHQSSKRVPTAASFSTSLYSHDFNRSENYSPKGSNLPVGQHPKSSTRINAIITGASRGIGLAIATSLASRGAHILLVARSEERLASATQRLTSVHQQLNPTHTPSSSTIARLSGDVGSKSTWQAVREHPWLERHAPNLLVNAAGVTHRSLLLRTPDVDVQDVLATNLTGTVLGCQIVGDIMIREHLKAKKALAADDQDISTKAIRSPCIVNVSSLLALRGGRGSSVYAASKAGILGLTQALAAEMGPSGVRVNAILPGYVETDMTDGEFVLILHLRFCHLRLRRSSYATLHGCTQDHPSHRQ
jgi:NAD(P)-dependent dehydrogenase (short-subunit alcohol dehydrogenase family)